MHLSTERGPNQKRVQSCRKSKQASELKFNNGLIDSVTKSLVQDKFVPNLGETLGKKNGQNRAAYTHCFLYKKKTRSTNISD